MKLITQGHVPWNSPIVTRWVVIEVEDTDWPKEQLAGDFSDEDIEEMFRREACDLAGMFPYHKGPGQAYANSATFHIQDDLIFMTQTCGLDV